MAEIVKLEAKKRSAPQKKKVAAYARVSTGSEKQEKSFAEQVSYYSSFIQSNLEWQYAGVYSDEGITGTSTKKRMGFQEMIADADAGKIDIILVKSISRFARNTVDLLEAVRHLKKVGVEVRFEEEHINSLSSDGELMLTILASFAQNESESLSNNIKWAIRKKYERGENWGKPPFGYDSGFHIIEKEAAVVRRIYEDYLAGISMYKTAEWARKQGFLRFSETAVDTILRSETYCGDLVMQRFYCPQVRKRVRNKGEVEMYHIAEHHEPIISPELYKLVREKMDRNRAFNPEADRISNVLWFSSKFTCGCCGNHYVASGGRTERMKCFKKIKHGADSCPNGVIIVSKLKKLCCEVLQMENFDEEAFTHRVKSVVVKKDGEMDFKLYDGTHRQARYHFYQAGDKHHMDPHTKVYGYTWDSRTRQYIVNDKEASIVRTVFKDYLDGMNAPSIARKLTSMGVGRNGHSVSRQRVVDILSNEFYTGRRICSAQWSASGKEEVLLDEHEPIVSDEIFGKAQKRRMKFGKSNKDPGNGTWTTKAAGRKN